MPFKLVGEYDYLGSLLRCYVHGSATDDPLVWYEGSAVSTATRRYLHANWQGSIAGIAQADGTIIAINGYDAYGIGNETNIGRFQYTGQAWLAELGLYYYKARMYSPTLGRFLQTDPIGYDDGMNLYVYVDGDPVNYSDPTGLCDQQIEDRTLGTIKRPEPIFVIGNYDWPNPSGNDAAWGGETA